MTLKIIHKNNTSAGQAPAPSDLDIGEIAVNSADAKLYIKDNDSAIRTFPNQTDINTSITTATTFTQSGDDAVARTFVSKLKDVVSVKDFGAVGDGVTDDTAKIQAAIDAVAAIAEFQRPILVIPSGSYLVTQLTWATNVSIKGDSRRSTRITCNGGSGVHGIVAPAGQVLGGASQFIRDIYFNRAIGQSADAINLNDASAINGIVIENCWFNGFDNAINIGDTDTAFGDVWVTDCVAELSKIGLSISGTTGGVSDDIMVNNFTAFKCPDFGIKAVNITDSTFSNIRLAWCGYQDSGSYALYFSGCTDVVVDTLNVQSPVGQTDVTRRLFGISGCSNFIVSSGTLRGRVGSSTSTDYGMAIVGTCSNIALSNLSISGTESNSTGFGISIGDGTNACNAVVISSCQTFDTGAAGIKFSNLANGALFGVSIVNPWKSDTTTATRPGIDLRSNGDHSVIGSYVSGANITTGHGIHASSDSDKKIISCTAPQGITATSSTRVFVDSCDTQGNGNLGQVVTATIDPPSIPASSYYSTTVTLTGARVSNHVEWAPGTTTLGDLVVSVFVSTTDTVKVVLFNPTASAIDPASSTWTFKLKQLA